MAETVGDTILIVIGVSSIVLIWAVIIAIVRDTFS